jgi:hypothetical protein
MEPVTPSPRGDIQPEDGDRISRAIEARGRAERELKAAVIAAANNGASVRALAGYTSLSTNTISRWKRESSGYPAV